MSYESVIGLEVHVQLNTETKIFCGCSTKFGEAPNTQTCPVCQGHPGVLPVLNKEVLKKAIMAGLALNCKIARKTKFDRKQYFYPDLPKAYQISQFDMPLCEQGFLKILVNDTEKKIGITRIHLEEDAGKLVHPETDNLSHSYVDLNRCGTPLIEIVTEPDIRNPEEAYQYLTNLKNILKYINISDCNMEEGSLRCDANISIRKKGSQKFGTKTEIKNMASFKGVQKALEYEIKRQIKAVKKGNKIIQETRLFDTDKGVTKSMRSKEEAHDYRYFPDPDLIPYEFDEDFIEKINETLPELPEAKKERFIKEYQVDLYDAQVLSSNIKLAEYFEWAVKDYPKQSKKIANWIMTEVLKALNDTNCEIEDFEVPPTEIAELFKLMDSGAISGKIAKKVFKEMIDNNSTAKDTVEKLGLKQISNSDDLIPIINKVIENNPKTVDEYKNGKKKAIGFIIGQIMKETKGQANPQLVNKILKDKLDN